MEWAKFKMFKLKIIVVAHIFIIISRQYRKLIYSYFYSHLSLIIDFVACPLQYMLTSNMDHIGYYECNVLTAMNYN